MTVKESMQLFRQELSPQFPTTEISSMAGIIYDFLLGYKRHELLLKGDHQLSLDHETQIYNIIKHLKQNKPLQYILGETEFYGLPLWVDESVLIPRPETEELVEWVIGDHKNQAPRVLDMGTGSGCIPITLKKFLPQASVLAGDISVEALATARKNADRNAVEVQFLTLDILAPQHIDLGMFDIIISNPPYVTQNQKIGMSPNVVDYEPHVALFVPENDPLLFYRAIAQFAAVSLNPFGNLYFEINEDLSDETAMVVAAAGFQVEKKLDIHGKYRMLKATRHDKS